MSYENAWNQFYPIKVYIFWESHKIFQILHCRFDWHNDLHRTNLPWRFHKILRPSQNIWTLWPTTYHHWFWTVFDVLHTTYPLFSWPSMDFLPLLVHVAIEWPLKWNKECSFRNDSHYVIYELGIPINCF